MKAMLGLTVCVLLIAAEGKEKDKTADPLTGQWKVTSAVFGGQKREQATGTLYTFKDGKMTRKTQMGEQVSTYKLETSKKPATIDLTVVGGQFDGMVRKGIFEVKGDELKLCVNFDPNAERPKDFAGKEQTEALVILKREAGDKSDKK